MALNMGNCKLLWKNRTFVLWCLVMIYISDCAYGCDSDGPIKQFPHCIGYWPPEYNPKSMKPTNYYNYTPTMSTNVEDLKMSTMAQERTVQVSILLPDSFHKKDIEAIQGDTFLERFVNSKTKKYLDRNVGLENLAFAQKRSGMGLLVGFQTIREKNLIRDDIFFNITLRDSKCHQTYGQKAFLDAYFEKVHVLFGPSCDLSLGKFYSYIYINTYSYLCFINKR